MLCCSSCYLTCYVFVTKRCRMQASGSVAGERCDPAASCLLKRAQRSAAKPLPRSPPIHHVMQHFTDVT
jgi:hypothetical protein